MRGPSRLALTADLGVCATIGGAIVPRVDRTHGTICHRPLPPPRSTAAQFTVAVGPSAGYTRLLCHCVAWQRCGDAVYLLS